MAVNDCVVPVEIVGVAGVTAMDEGGAGAEHRIHPVVCTVRRLGRGGAGSSIRVDAARWTWSGELSAPVVGK